ncbi:MAG TPA: hypothetical protein VFQ43_16550 [Nitrososphaera sp.]|nr:hypothetical protein [Nitrososphaera sp.]
MAKVADEDQIWAKSVASLLIATMRATGVGTDVDRSKTAFSAMASLSGVIVVTEDFGTGALYTTTSGIGALYTITTSGAAGTGAAYGRDLFEMINRSARGVEEQGLA